MIIAVFLSFQIILFLQLTTVCMKSVKSRQKAGRLPNTVREKKNTSKAEQDKQKNEKREEKENRSDKKHGEKEKKKTSEIKCEEMKASEKKNEKEKDEGEKEETKKDEENKKEKKEQEKDEEKKTEEEKKEDQGKDKLKKEDETANDKKDLKEGNTSGLKLDVSPAELKWEFEQGQQAIKVKNNTMKRFAVKVKCTDTNIYTVAPAIAFVDAGKLLTIAVVRDKGAMKKDKIVVCSMPVSDDEKDAAEVFKNVNPNVNVIPMDKRIYV